RRRRQPPEMVNAATVGHTPGVFNLIWLVPALPLAGSVVNFFWGRRLGRRTGVLASAAVGLALVVSVALLVGLLGHSSDDRLFIQHLGSWVPVGALQVGIDLRIDPLSMVMILSVTGVSTLIHVYSIGYMRGDPRESRYFAEL